MCGIAGKISFHNTVSEQDVLRMTSAIAHRGPDDEGVYVNGGVGLGSRRLAILDLSPSGHMPMTTPDESLVIVYNGEVYNYQEYWEELRRDGVSFRSRSDTEIILYLYQKYGVDCVSKLRGMFAFVIYDRKKNLLFGARDRFGKKPLKYYLDDYQFLFASELKAIVADKMIPRAVDYRAVLQYLTYQYVPSPNTGFVNIKKLPPAHYFTLNLSTHQLSLERYWRPHYQHPLKLSESEWKERILTELEKSVQLRMISDVPLGAFLSGGVDSSAVVAMMARHSSHPVKTFSIGFDEKDFDERHYARMVAKHFGTEHHEMIVRPAMIDDLPKLVRHYEEPYGDPSMLPTYYLSQFTREHVTVALNGDGGDENFAGYTRYTVLDKGPLFEKIPRPVRKMGREMLGWIDRVAPSYFLRKAIRFADSLDRDTIERYIYYICYYTDQEKREMVRPEFLHLVESERSDDFLRQIFLEADGKTLLDKILYTDANSYLPEDLMVKVDIASMAVSLESRSPLLDHVFFEMTSQIPSTLKYHKGETKYIFKKALEGTLPDEILYRKKMGFGLPAGAWFQGDLKEYFVDLVVENSHFLSTLIDKRRLREIFEDTIRVPGGEGRRLWLLLCLELWYREYFE